MNLFVVNGNLTRDVELKTTSQGTEYAWITVASRSSDGGAIFVDVKIWDKAAVNLQNHRSKGEHVIVHAELEQYTVDHEDGTKRTVNQFVSRSIEYVGASQK